MEEKMYSLRIEELSENGTTGADYAIITEAQYHDIMALAAVKSDDYKAIDIDGMKKTFEAIRSTLHDAWDWDNSRALTEIEEQLCEMFGDSCDSEDDTFPYNS